MLLYLEYIFSYFSCYNFSSLNTFWCMVTGDNVELFKKSQRNEANKIPA